MRYLKKKAIVTANLESDSVGLLWQAIYLRWAFYKSPIGFWQFCQIVELEESGVGLFSQISDTLQAETYAVWSDT